LAESLFDRYSRQEPICSEGGDDVPIIPENYRNLQQFLLKDNWDALLSGTDIDYLLQLTALPEKGEFGDLNRHVLVFLDQYQEVLKRYGTYSVRRDIGTRPA
jgi:hypothetical protein